MRLPRRRQVLIDEIISATRRDICGRVGGRTAIWRNAVGGEDQDAGQS